MAADSIDKKLWPFFILKVLQNHALEGRERDEENNSYLTRRQIVDFLKEDYGIDTQIKAVGDNLSRLHDTSLDHPELGFRLEYLEGERSAAGASSSSEATQLLRKGWRLVPDSEFESSEIRMLIDTVIASPIIPESQAKTLIGKLLPLSTEKIVVPDLGRVGHHSAINPEFFLNVELLNEAILKHKRVRFMLCSFGKDGKLYGRGHGGHARTHNVIPMQMLISKGHYYLLAHYPNSEEVFKFRIDMMGNVEIVDDSNVDAAESRVNVVKFREQHSYMMSGKVMKVVLRINKDSLHTLFDQFGPGVHFKNEQEDTIDVEVRSALYSVLFWALQYYRAVEVLSPPELRDVLANAGNTISEMYSGEPGAISLAERQSRDEGIR